MISSLCSEWFHWYSLNDGCAKNLKLHTWSNVSTLKLLRPSANISYEFIIAICFYIRKSVKITRFRQKKTLAKKTKTVRTRHCFSFSTPNTRLFPINRFNWLNIKVFWVYRHLIQPDNICKKKLKNIQNSSTKSR